MELSEFLLARTADTIAHARAVQSQGVTDGLELDDPRRPPLSLARWAIEDAAAKRRIVELAATTGPDGSGNDLARAEMTAVLRLLAAPYADHPDYRTEWKP